MHQMQITRILIKSYSARIVYSGREQAEGPEKVIDGVTNRTGSKWLDINMNATGCPYAPLRLH